MCCQGGGVVGLSPWEDVVFFVTGASVLALGLAWSKKVMSCHFISAARALLTRGRRITASLKDSGDPDVGCLVTDRIIELRVTYLRMALTVHSLVSLVVGLSIVWGILRVVGRAASWQHEVLHMVFQPYMAAVLFFPKIITARNIDGHFLFFLLFYAAIVSPPAKPNIVIIMGSNTRVIAVNFVRGTTSRQRLPLFFLGNACFALSAAASMNLNTNACLVNVMPNLFWSWAEVFCMLGFCVGAYFVEENLRTTVRQSLQLEEVKELYSAACALLRSCCDVVVELDAERRILSTEPDLGSYLMRGVTMQGRLLDDLIVDEDTRNLFKDAFSNPKEEAPTLAEAMQVSFKDGWDSPVRVELLWFHFRRLDGQARHMVGIRDFSEGTHPPGQRQGDGDEAQRDTYRVPSQDDGVRRFFSGSQCSPATPSAVSEAADDFDIGAVVDCGQAGCPIRSLTYGFCTQIGRLPIGSYLLDHVAKPQRVQVWLQDCLNFAVYGEELQEGRVTFKMPQGRVSTRCTMVAGPNLDVNNITLSFTKRSIHEGNEGTEEPARLRGTPSQVSNTRARLRSCLCDFWCDGDTTGCCGKDLVFTDFETYIFSTSVGSGANVITDVTLVGLAAWHDNVGGPSCCVVCAVEHMASRER